MQDLQLSLFGFKLGKMIRAGTINNRAYAARWIRSNIGGVNDSAPVGDVGDRPDTDTTPPPFPSMPMPM